MGRPRKTESEKKETSKARFQRYKVKHVNIGKEINRWIHLKGIVGTDSDETLAQFLMDRLMYANADIAAAAQSNVPTEKARMRTEASDKRRSNRGDLYEQLSHTDIVEMFGSNRDVVGERKAICMHTDLLDLANLKIRRICSKKFCNKMVNVSAKYIGTAIQLIWNCSNNHHAYTWNSQPQFNNTPAVDLMLPSISDADYLAVKLTFRRIGIELVSSTTTSEKGQNTTETMYNDFTFVKKESECPNMNSESPQEYPLVGIENIKTEVQTEGTSVEDDNSNDRILGSEEIKIEVMDEEETDTASETATDEEFTEVLDFLNKAKHVKKILVTGDNVTEDCGVRSSRIKERGYRPDYVGLDWNDEMETPEELKSEEPKGVKKNKDAKYSKKDLDFQISDSDYDESDESDGVIDDVTDDGINEENNSGAEISTCEQSENTSKKRKFVSRKERMKRSCMKKEKKNDVKKPWIKIRLEDHEDKFQTEKVESFERKNRRTDASENLYSCLVCQHFKCSTKDSIENHLEKHINKVLECEHCQYIGYCNKDIREHKKKCVGTDKAVFICDICGMSAHSKESKRNHMGKVHDKPEWKCIFCSVMSKTKGERLEHMKQVHPEPCQYCEACRKSKFDLSKEDFENHKKNCTSKEQCEICGQLTAKGGMRKHVHDKHENVRKYQCEKCPYSAKSFKCLQRHLYSHDKIHPFSCDQCSFTCVQAYQLVSHMRTHTGEKPYKCTQCKYAAAWNVQLKDHVKVHSMETAVTCEKCEVMFKNEKTLNLHQKKGQCLI